jgi:hypothetical protein
MPLLRDGDDGDRREYLRAVGRGSSTVSGDRVTRRPKLACRACVGTVVQAPAPPRLIEGGIPTEALVAHVLVARYADHLPLL